MTAPTPPSSESTVTVTRERGHVLLHRTGGREPLRIPAADALDLADVLADAAAEELLDQAQIQNLSVVDGKAELTLLPPRSLSQRMAEFLAEWLGTAENYTETPFCLGHAVDEQEIVHDLADGGGYVLTVRRRDGKTPDQLRKEAEARADELAEQLEDAQAELDGAYQEIADLRGPRLPESS